MLAAIQCRHADRNYRFKIREEKLKEISELNLKKDEFYKRKTAVQESGEEWTEGEFTTPIPKDPLEETDNDIE